MKKLFSFIFSLCVIVMMQAQTSTPPTAGDGTSGNPYQIATLENLYWLSQTSNAWSSYFIQTADIDASTTSTWNSGSGFSPIGNSSTKFTGEYNGKGYVISGIKIYQPSSSNIGLFGCTNRATIYNIGLTNSAITGGGYTGAIIGSASSTNLSNSYCEGTVSGSSDFLGGLVGWFNGNSTSISSCYFSGSVSGASFVGGIAGQNYSDNNLTYITNCYSTGSVIGTSGYVGGITGDIIGGTDSYCYTTAAISGSSPCGGITGRCYNSTVTECIWNTETTGQSSGGNIGGWNSSFSASGKTTAEMTTESTFTDAGWDFIGETINGTEDIWAKINTINSSYPCFVWQIKTFVISTSAVTDITNISATLNGVINANNNAYTVTFEYGTSTSFGTSVNATPSAVSGNSVTAVNYVLSGLTPNTLYYIRAVATNSGSTVYGNTISFRTLLSGDGSSANPYQISTLNDLKWLSENSDNWDKNFIQTADIDATETSAWNSGSGFSPIGNNNTNFKGHYNGKGHTIINLTISRSTTDYIGLFGYIDSGATVDSIGVGINNIAGQNYVGGLIGYNKGTVRFCHTTGVVSGSLSVGGFIGTNSGGAVSYSHSSVTTTGSYDVAAFIGDNLIGSTINYCYATGNSNGSTASGCYTSGGLVGWNESNISNCYATGNVTGNAPVGGLVGGIGSGAVVSNSYAVGTVTGTNPGGLAGNSNGTISNCFYNNEIFTVSTSYGTGKTTVELKTQSTFTTAGWDFNSIWAIGTGSYPVLRYQLSTVTWNGSWTPNNPTNMDMAIINGNYNAAGFSCYDLNVNAGKQLTVASGILNVNGNLTLKSDDLNGTATLVLENNGTVTVSGTTSVEQYLTAKTGDATTDNWWYISSPVTGATSAVFNPASTASDKNLFGYYDEPTVSYPQITTNNVTLTTGTGYVVSLGGATGSHATYTFTGTLNNGDIPVTVTRTGTTAGKRGFNLVGNPYPSYLDWNALQTASNTAASNTNVRSTIWYRTRTSGGEMQFDTFGGTTGTGVGKNGLVSQYIPPMQAFWMKVDVDNSNATLTFKNIMRSHKDQSVTTNRLKAPALATIPIVRLKVSNGINSDEAIVVSDPNALDVYDRYDAPKMTNSNVNIPEIYTLAGAEELVINHLNTIVANKELSLGFRPGKTGEFTIEATEINNLDSDLKVMLLDKQTNTQQELTPGLPYSFNSDAMATNDRFSVQFKSSSISTGFDDGANDGNILVYRNLNNRITVICNARITGTSSVSVYNAMGQKLAQESLTSAKTEINGAFASGIYIVGVNTGVQTITRKLIIK